jgi:hypothetical protein
MQGIKKANLIFDIIKIASQSPGAGGVNLGNYLKLKDGSNVSDIYDTPSKLVNLIVSNLFVLAGIILFVFIILAGFKFISASDSKGKDESKSIITGVLIGFLVMFSAYWIIQIIEGITGVQILF